LSDGYISNLIDEETQFGTPLELIDKNLQFLDSSHSDLELMEIWNGIFDSYGFRIPKLEERWYRDNGIKDFGEKDESSEPIGGKIDEFLKMKKITNEMIDLG
jgi:hypothetical protein